MLKITVLTAAFLGILFSLAQADTINLTTYYPAPTGQYNSLRLTPGAALACNATNLGSFTNDAIGQLLACTTYDGGATQAWAPAGHWRLNSGTPNLIYLQDTSAFVGIGNTNPSQALDVSGNAVVSGTITGGTVNSSGNMTATGTVTGATVNSTGNMTAAGTVTGATVNSTGNMTAAGTVTGATVNSTGNITATGDINSATLNTTGNINSVSDIFGNNVNANFANVADTLTVQSINAQIINASNTIIGNNLFSNTSITAATSITGATLGITGNGSIGGDLVVTGTVTANGYIHSSDQRLKTDIVRIPKAIDKLQKLNGVSFKWKKTGAQDIGLIAQNVEAVFPELVATDKDGMKSVKYDNLVALLIEAVKEQQKEIDGLKKALSQIHK